MEGLESKGAIFVEELDEVPPGVPVVFSAHGVPKSVIAEADGREMHYFDATCPLVTKVHVDVARHRNEGKQLVLIGHAGHPEVAGTLGQLPKGEMLLVENAEEAETLEVHDPDNLAFVTQTTLSVDDTAEIVSILRRRFPNIEAPRKEDICYATTNRQAAVKALAPDCDALIVLGAPYSSNSKRLVEVARTSGCEKSLLIQRSAELDDDWLRRRLDAGHHGGRIGARSSGSELIDRLSENRSVMVEERSGRREHLFQPAAALTV